ncbi:MAG: class B sortase [Coriobacteriia bacterium]|nr:class B sortase [Coriobacteriia bacterium]
MNTVANTTRTAPVGNTYKTPRGIKIADSFIDLIVIAIILAFLAFTGYSYWDSDQMLSGAMPDQYEIYKPGEDMISFEELRAINPDVFGWITVYGTNIDFPLLQGEDNHHYLNHNAKGEFSLAGAIYLDIANDKNFTDFNHIIHGHHMEQGAMFGNLDLFTDPEFFDTRKWGNLFFNGEDHGLEFFAFMETSGYNWRIFNPAITDPERQVEYLAEIDETSMHTRDIGVTTDDRIVLLATCTSETTNGRHLLAARLTDPFPNPFAETEEEIERTQFVDGALTFMRNVCLPALLLVILLVVAYQIYARRKRWSDEDKIFLHQAKVAAEAANGDNGAAANGNGSNGSTANGANGVSAANGAAANGSNGSVQNGTPAAKPPNTNGTNGTARPPG